MNAKSGAKATAGSINPITLEVVRNGVISICNQIDANITRTAFSTYIYEYRDFSVGLVGPTGDLIAQSTGAIPIFVADSVAAAVRDGIALHGIENLKRGDVLVCNHAEVQGQHLNNTVMYTPIFSEREGRGLLGFFAINVHWIDIGGGAVGSSGSKASDIFGEGLQLRSIRLWRQGQPNDDVYRIIENNTRFPVELMGDIAAQYAGCLMGRDRVAALADKYGPTVYLQCIDRIMDDSEQAARARIRDLPDGVYEAESFLDNDGKGKEPVRIKIKAIVQGDQITVDYSDVADQTPGPINSGFFGGGQTAARVAFKYLIATGDAANEGTYRPLKIVLPKGKFLNAAATAPMGHYSAPLPTVIDTIIKALSGAMPEQATGAHFGSFSGFGFKGRDAKSGRIYRCHDSAHGGWGASGTQDGSGPYRTMAHGDTRIIPVELQESQFPFVIEEFALRVDSGGAGKYRGGLGTVKRYRITEKCTAIVNFERIKCPPWGVAGGRDGATGRVTLYRAAKGSPEVVYKGEYDLEPGDNVMVESGGGGGFGDPAERTPALLQKDIEFGYVSTTAARDDYARKIN